VLRPASPMEVVAYRALGTWFFASVALVLGRQMGTVVAIVRNRRQASKLLLEVVQPLRFRLRQRLERDDLVPLPVESRMHDPHVPPADLLVMKDVLQHLNTATILEFPGFKAETP